MERSKLLFFLGALLIAGLAGAWYLTTTGGAGEPLQAPPISDDGAQTGVDQAPLQAATRQERIEQPTAESRREVAADPRLDDPAIQQALCGFRGRIVDYARTPVAATGVQFFRGSVEGVLPDLKTALTTGAYVPDIDAGESRTDDQGRFLVTGVWPHGMYFVLAGVGSENPTLQLVERSPGPGEVIDLGDVQLKHGAVLTGLVTDGDGKPLAGAQVRAADLPGAVLQFVPVERFDPEGALIVRESEKMVVEFPSWVKQRFAQLPFPTTHTGADGRFRLTGVEPRDVMMAVTAPRLLSHINPRIKLRPGETRDIGTIRMDPGESVVGKVVDTAGKPVGGAEVVLAPTSVGAPVDFAMRLPPLPEDGRFEVPGFKAGKVTAAARRGKDEPWTVLEPTPTSTDLLITLAATHSLTVRVKSKEGQPIEGLQVNLCRGNSDDEAVGMTLFGLRPRVGKEEPLANEPRGRRFTGLIPGIYYVCAQCRGHVARTTKVTLERDQEVEVELQPSLALAVLVRDTTGKPIRNARIYLEDRGGALSDFPSYEGMTGGDGRLVIRVTGSKRVRVQALHPAYGDECAEANPPGAEIVITFAAPGAVEGVLTDNGGVPEPGKWVIGIARASMSRQVMPTMPKMTITDADGRFRVLGLAPGRYEAVVLESFRAVQSPGLLYQLMMRISRSNPNEHSFEIASGQTTRVQLDASRPPELTGPGARVTGSVMIDGQPATGALVTSWGAGNQRSVAVDASGRFDLGRVSEGHLSVSVRDPESENDWRATLAQRSLQVKANEDQILDFTVQTTGISGYVRAPDGQPVGSANVTLSAMLQPQGSKTEMAHTWRQLTTKADGTFSTSRLPAGKYSIEVHSPMGRGYKRGLELAAGLPVSGVEIDLLRTMSVSGRMDLRPLGGRKTGWMSMSLVPVDRKPGEDLGQSWSSIESDGAFSFQHVLPGRYRIQIWIHFVDDDNPPGRNTNEYRTDGEVLVGNSDLKDLVFVPIPKQDSPARGGR
jgi:protocatechuate 3,4-dioxygenase beta subunit